MMAVPLVRFRYCRELWEANLSSSSVVGYLQGQKTGFEEMTGHVLEPDF